MIEKQPDHGDPVPPDSLSPAAGRNTRLKNDDLDTTGILLIGSFTVLVVIFLIIAVDAYFHFYRHQLATERLAGISNQAAQVQARQLADLTSHWVDTAKRRATVGIQLAEQMVLADYTPGAPPVLLASRGPANMSSTGGMESMGNMDGMNGHAPMQSSSSNNVPLHELGAKIYQSMGCSACHTVNGQPSAGPTWKNLAGYPQHLTNGKSPMADYHFLKYMILHPDQWVVQGSAPIMPDIYYNQLAGPQHPHRTKLNALIWYINTLSNRSNKSTQPPVPDSPPASPQTAAPKASSAAQSAAPAATLRVMGAKLYHSMGCSACHTVNGQPGAGPTWKNLSGYPQHLTNGKSPMADYHFLKYMILHPDKLVVKGFAPIMPDMYYDQLAGPQHPHQTKLKALIEYINSLSDRGGKNAPPGEHK